MTDWFVSDTHWGHANVIRYSKRPFSNVDEMDKALINNWNSVVEPGDNVYHLGDVTFGKTGFNDAILYSLNGNKHLVRGNHDKLCHKPEFNKHWVWIKDYHELKIDGRLLVLQHYPLLTWNKAHKDPAAWMLHGHSHGNLNHVNMHTTRLDVGVDSHNYKPISYAEVSAILSKRKYQAVDHHGKVVEDEE